MSAAGQQLSEFECPACGRMVGCANTGGFRVCPHCEMSMTWWQGMSERQRERHRALMDKQVAKLLTREEFRFIQLMCDKACEHLQGLFDEDDANRWQALEKKLAELVR